MTKKVRLINNGNDQIIDTSSDEYRQLYEEGRIYSQDDTGDLFGGELEEVVISPTPSNRIERIRAEKLEQITRESFLENQIPAWGKWHDTSPDNMGAYEKSYQNFIDKQTAKQLLEDNPFEGRYPGAKKTQQDRRDWYNSFTPEERELIQKYSSTSRTFGPAISQHNKDEKVRKDSEYGVIGGFFKKEGLRAKAAAASDNLRMGMNKQGWGRTFEDFVNMPAYTASIGGRTALIPTNVAEGNYLEAAMPIGEAALMALGAKGGQQLVKNALLPIGGTPTTAKQGNNYKKFIENIKVASDIRVTMKRGEVNVRLPLSNRAAVKKRTFFAEPMGTPLTDSDITKQVNRATELSKAYMLKKPQVDTGTLDFEVKYAKDFQERFLEKVNNILSQGGEGKRLESTTAFQLNRFERVAEVPKFRDILTDPLYRQQYPNTLGIHQEGKAVAFPTEVTKVIGEKSFNVSLTKPEGRGILPKVTIKKNPDKITAFSKYRTKEELFDTIVHEIGHETQRIEEWRDVINSFSEQLNYWVANESTPMGKTMKDAMVEGVRWNSAPIELHSELFTERIKAAHKLSSDPQIAIQKMYENLDAIDAKIIKSGVLNQFFKSTTPNKQKLKIVNMLPSAIPTAAALEAMTNQQKD